LPVGGARQPARMSFFDLAPAISGFGLTYTYINQNMVVSDGKIEAPAAGHKPPRTRDADPHT